MVFRHYRPNQSNRSPWQVQERRPNCWPQWDMLWRLKAHAGLQKEVLSFQNPECWFRSFALSRWLLTTIWWLYGKRPCWSSCSIKRASMCMWHLIEATLQTHVDGKTSMVWVVVERRIKISKWSKLWPHCHIAALLLSHSANTVMSSAVSSPAFWSCTSLVFIAVTAHQTQHNMRESRILQTQQAGILCTMSIGLLTVPGNRYIGNVIAVFYCTGLDRRTWWVQVFVSWKNFFYRYAFRFYGSSVCRVQA